MNTVKAILSHMTREDPLNFRLSLMAAKFLVLFLIFFFPNHGHAAAPKTSGALLTNTTQILYIGPHGYLTPDPEGKVSLVTLSESFQHKGLKGQKLASDLVSLPLSGEAAWIVFEIYNDTETEGWILDFGDVKSGRLGHAGDLAIVNVTTNKVFTVSSNLTISGLPPVVNIPMPQDAFLGISVPVDLKPKSQNLLALHVKLDKGLGMSIAPRLLSEKYFMSSLLSGDPGTILGGLFFVVVMAIFTTFLYISRKVSYLYLLGYFALSCGLFFGLNQFFVSSAFIQGPYIVALYVLSIFSALLHTRSHLRIRHYDHPTENAILVVLGLFAAAGASAYIFALHDMTGYAFFSAAAGLAFVGIIVISLFLDDTMPAVTRIFSAGWLVHLLAFSLLSLGVVNVIELNKFIVLTFWLSFIPQSGLFVLGSVRSLKYAEEMKEQEDQRRKHNEQIRVRLQKSKEAADQARLLRVIERERELMSELREREVQRAEEMRFAKDEADRANMAKSAFLAVVSHEIRTPMTGIMGMVQLLQDTNMNRVQSDYVDTIKKSGQTMMTLLNDILDFEKIERGSMDIEEVQFDLPRLAQDIVTLMSGHAAQKNLFLKLETNPDLPHIVWGDPTRIRQILLNLVNNGLKFTHEGGVIIRLSARRVEKGEGHPEGTTLILFSVADTGIGISKEAQLKLFTPFTQAEASITRQYGGTGLGLAISDKLVDAMGGKIRVKSEVGNGTEFYFELPMDIESEETEGLPEPENDEVFSIVPMKILVVEDNEMNRKVLQGLLSKYDHDVLMAANGFEALEQCEKEHPELIFMDIQMGGMNGLEAARKIRTNPVESVSRIPIIALTGNVLPEDIEAIFEAEMNGFLAKPIDSHRLNEIIFNASKGQFERPLPPKATGDAFANLTGKDLGFELDEREVFEERSESSLPVSRIPKDKDGDEAGDFSYEAFRQSLEDDDEEEINPLDYGDDISASISESSKNRKNDLSFNDDEELTEIQKFLLSQGGGGTGPAAKTSAKTDKKKEDPLFKTDKRGRREPPERKDMSKKTQASVSPTKVEKTEEFLDHAMLENLVSTLGKDQFAKLLEGFLSKADEIITQIDSVLENEDLAGLAARSHELKGMAANFGMAEVSRLAALSEKASKTSDQKGAFKNAALLRDANEKTKSAFTAWLDRL
ncbi:MAG: response regulator [Rhodospirillales bacterium]|nr:response regulator [Rhodospirillales bacterium]